ncbi:hypothetical protein QTP70_019223 [Hemibagrus guttatus]|uniref:Uncharacterized protein n=1 Tax=Hemibagrus guttatus TaxID=175788 RepID=A0AAE0R0Y4_9TELE|nr:hypothetical protein QTP70_019223 [Hemibagrus guttatus]
MGSLTPIKSSPILNNGSPTILGKRTYEQHNGLDGSKSKVLGPQWDIMSKRMPEQGRPPSAMQDNEVNREVFSQFSVVEGSLRGSVVNIVLY